MRAALVALFLAVGMAVPSVTWSGVPPPRPGALAPTKGSAPSAATPLKLREGRRPVRDSGIGAVLKIEDEKILIGQILLGLGAQAAGLGRDDEILAVDGTATKGRQLPEVLLWIRGEKGVPVELTVRRAGAAQPEKLVIVRRPLKDAKLPAPEDYAPAPVGTVTIFRLGDMFVAVRARSLKAEPGASPVAEVAWRIWLPALPSFYGVETIELAKRPALAAGPFTLTALIAGEPSGLYLRAPGASRCVTSEQSLMTIDPGSPGHQWITPPPPPPAPPAPVAAATAPAAAKVELLGKASPVVIVDRWVNQAPAVGKDLGGQALLIDFWATWCGPCKQSMPAIADLARDLGGKGLTVVGISIDEDVEAVEAFLKAKPLPYAIGWTLGEELGRFGQSGIPALVLVGPDGIVRMIHTGAPIPSDEIRKKVAELVKPAPTPTPAAGRRPAPPK